MTLKHRGAPRTAADSDTMHIKNENTATRRIHDARFMDDDYVVEFSANGVANVKQDVGEALAQSDDYSGITEHNGDDDE